MIALRPQDQHVPETITSWDRGWDQDQLLWDRDRDRDQKVVSRPRWSRDLNIPDFISHQVQQTKKYRKREKHTECNVNTHMRAHMHI